MKLPLRTLLQASIRLGVFGLDSGAWEPQAAAA